MKKIALILTILISVLNLKAQDYKIRTNIDKDSLLNASVKRLPKKMREEYIKLYNEGDEQAKEFLLYMISMPESSKKELIENYEGKKAEIQKLKEEYSKFVPKNYIIDIEFEPEGKVLNTPEEITIKIYTISDKSDNPDGRRVEPGEDNVNVVSQNWNLKPGSKELEKVLKSIGWTNQTLKEIKAFLKNANCISIKNGNVTTVGFARSGMGKYSYKIFQNDLTPDQMKEFNHGCQYIFYKNNIVLEYGGGAVGSQCFEKD